MSIAVKKLLFRLLIIFVSFLGLYISFKDPFGIWQRLLGENYRMYLELAVNMLMPVIFTGLFFGIVIYYLIRFFKNKDKEKRKPIDYIMVVMGIIMFALIFGLILILIITP